jgi:hypothetical protein
VVHVVGSGLESADVALSVARDGLLVRCVVRWRVNQTARDDGLRGLRGVDRGWVLDGREQI